MLEIQNNKDIVKDYSGNSPVSTDEYARTLVTKQPEKSENTNENLQTNSTKKCLFQVVLEYTVQLIPTSTSVFSILQITSIETSLLDVWAQMLESFFWLHDLSQNSKIITFDSCQANVKKQSRLCRVEMSNNKQLNRDIQPTSTLYTFPSCVFDEKVKISSIYPKVHNKQIPRKDEDREFWLRKCMPARAIVHPTWLFVIRLS